MFSWFNPQKPDVTAEVREAQLEAYYQTRTAQIYRELSENLKDDLMKSRHRIRLLEDALAKAGISEVE